MTAEVAILNGQGVAMAADSAVTARLPSGEKIFTSANKIFALSKYQPVGVMVHGNATFMGVPWETIVKTYRKSLGVRSFKRLPDYASDLLRFLGTNEVLFPKSAQEGYVRQTIFSYFAFMRKQLEQVLRSKLEKGRIGRRAVRAAVAEMVDSHHKRWIQAQLLPGVPKGTTVALRERCVPVVEQACSKVFEELPMSKQRLDRLLDIAAALLLKERHGISSPSASGVVLAGFGADDRFPSLRSFIVEGAVDGVLQATLDRQADIGENLRANITAFAQQEMVFVFMEGVDPDYQKAIEKDLADIVVALPGIVIDELSGVDEEGKRALKARIAPVAESMLRQYGEKLVQFRRNRFVDPIVAAVAMLPKDELATMAESLVSLTSLKRRFSMEAETVGGPTDVAVISKGDGLVWIKRKHYFKPELNPHFSANYLREVADEERT